MLLGDLAPPVGEQVSPGDERVVPRTDRIKTGDAAPAIVVHERHRHFLPVIAAGRAHEKGGGDGVVTIGEHVRLHDELFADSNLGGKAAGVDFRRDGFDGDTVGGERDQGLVGRAGGFRRLPFGFGAFCA